MTAVAPPPIDAPPTSLDRSPQPEPTSSPVSVLSSPQERVRLVHVAVLAALCAIGLFGFGSAYGGSRYFVAGMVGLALGLGVGWWGARTRQPLVVVVAGGVLAFFIFGGAAAVPNHAIAGLLPGPATVVDLVDGAIQGWARLLTMNPPVGDTANLLVVPYLSGIVAGALAVSLALRTRHPAFALPVPVLLVILSILFGTMRPASLLLQGTVFGGLTLWWLTFVQRSRRRVDTGTRRRRRWIGVLAVLGVASLAANFGWHLMPGATSNPRLVLRTYAKPLFDPADYPSPLIEYRRYTNGANESGWHPSAEELDAGAPVGDPATPSDQKDSAAHDGWRSDALFEVKGLPADQRLRLSTLDTYDRVVYSVGNGPGSSGYFQRAGRALPESTSGPIPRGSSTDVTVKVLGSSGGGNLYNDIWLPVPDDATGVRFTDRDSKRADQLSGSLLWNTTTGTGAVKERLNAGDSYTVTAVRSTPPRRKDFVDAAAAKLTMSAQQVESVDAMARTAGEHWACRQPNDPPDPNGTDPNAPPPPTETPISPKSVYDKMLLIAQGLRVCGGLSDGASSRRGIASFPGHSDGRLTQMVGDTSTGMLGNGEQFAPLAALLANASGVPARVVMGFRSEAESNRWRKAHGLAPNDGAYVIRGSDITAWIEVALDRGDGPEWVPVLDVTPTKPEPQLRPAPQPRDPDSDPPPPPPSIPPSEEQSEAENCRSVTAASETSGSKASGKTSAKGAGKKASAKDAAKGSGCDSKPIDESAKGFQIPAWVVKAAAGVVSPFLLLGAVTAAIGGVKARRRNRRRTRGTPDERVDGGWHEVTDLACDLGAPVPARVTRYEAGAMIARPEAAQLAKHADSVVFGPGEVAESQVAEYWDEVDATRVAMLSDLTRFGRWKALVSLSSLRAARPLRVAAPARLRRQSASST